MKIFYILIIPTRTVCRLESLSQRRWWPTKPTKAKYNRLSRKMKLGTGRVQGMLKEKPKSFFLLVFCEVAGSLLGCLIKQYNHCYCLDFNLSSPHPASPLSDRHYWQRRRRRWRGRRRTWRSGSCCCCRWCSERLSSPCGNLTEDLHRPIQQGWEMCVCFYSRNLCLLMHLIVYFCSRTSESDRPVKSSYSLSGDELSGDRVSTRFWDR